MINYQNEELFTKKNSEVAEEKFSKALIFENEKREAMPSLISVDVVRGCESWTVHRNFGHFDRFLDWGGLIILIMTTNFIFLVFGIFLSIKSKSLYTLAGATAFSIFLAQAHQIMNNIQIFELGMGKEGPIFSFIIIIGILALYLFFPREVKLNVKIFSASLAVVMASFSFFISGRNFLNFSFVNLVLWQIFIILDIFYLENISAAVLLVGGVYFELLEKVWSYDGFGLMPRHKIFTGCTIFGFFLISNTILGLRAGNLKGKRKDNYQEEIDGYFIEDRSRITSKSVL